MDQLKKFLFIMFFAVESLPSPKREQPERVSIPPPKYDTLLHRKLRDRNISLQDDICEAAGEAFQYAIKELNNTNQMLTRSQTVIQVSQVKFHFNLSFSSSTR